MLQKLKDACLWIIGGLGAIIGLLWFFLARKGDKIDELNAKIALVSTQREADLMEVEIKRLMQDKKLLKKELDELDISLLLLSQRRDKIAARESGRSPEDIEEYWDN